MSILKGLSMSETIWQLIKSDWERYPYKKLSFLYNKKRSKYYNRIGLFF